MSTTTQILFNSPALHSLKRDQLVKLCKIHSVKASGKNIELIDRLKHHAQTLPKDSPLSIAVRKELGEDNEDDSQNTEDGNWKTQLPRPSEQWEVMESIEEQEEGSLSSLRTIGSHTASGEFGTRGSKSSTVGSSIKALATSLGLRRHNSKNPPASSSATSSMTSFPQPTTDELTQHSMPYSALPEATTLPQNDHFTFATSDNSNPVPMRLIADPTPLPGHALRPGLPAPLNARLSLGLGLGAPSTPTKQQQTTTIRLISSTVSTDNDGTTGGGLAHPRTPQLKPFETTFDLVLGSPTLGSRMWPRDDTPGLGIYPALPTDAPSAPRAMEGIGMHIDSDEDAPMPGRLSAIPPHTPVHGESTSKALSSDPNALALPPHPVTPFVFGSPNPQSAPDTQFRFRSAAASVLDEMNKRLGEEGVDGIGLDLINKLDPYAARSRQEGEGQREVKALPKKSNGAIKEKFEKMHEEEFAKMESIAVAVERRISPTKPIFSGAAGGNAIAGKKRKSSVLDDGKDGRRKISGTRVITHGRRVVPGAFGVEDEEAAEDEEDSRGGKRVRVDIDSQNNDVHTEEDEEAAKIEEEKKLKEREAIRRRLDMNKAKRRSSMGVAGGNGKGRVSVGRSGGGLPKPKVKSGKFGFFSSAKTMVQSVWNRGKSNNTAPTTTSTAAPPNSGIPKPVITTKNEKPGPSGQDGKKPHLTASHTITGSSSSRNQKEKGKDSLTPAVSSTATRARSPIPSFGSTRSSNPPSTRHSRAGSSIGTSIRSSGIHSGVSSIGTKTSSTSRTSSTGVSSMGTKKSLGSTPSTSTSSKLSSARLSSSRLLAPTVSSLAKTARTSNAGLKGAASADLGSKGKAEREGKSESMLMNGSTITGKLPFSPRPGGIFSKPLEMPSRIPSPVKSTMTSTSRANETNGAGAAIGHSELKPKERQRTLSGRKPRISRSKVIARLASQRAAGTGGSGPISGPSNGGKTRSSLGAKRQSVGGGRGGDALMSAKKRARQSEYGRRKSRAGSGNAMDIDM